MRALKNLGLYGTRAGTKFIPSIYKVASKEDRLWLLAGLMDTDGCLGQLGKYYDCISKSRTLANDVCFVARSLGLAAYMKPCFKTWQNGTGQYYRVSIFGNTSLIPCQIPTKQVRSQGHVSPHSLTAQQATQPSPLVTGFTVELVGSGPYYGFACDGDQRYLMGDFTVTHNSGKDAFHVNPTLKWGWTQSTLNLDCQNGEMYDATGKIRAQYGRVEAFAPYRSPLGCINVLDAIRLGKPEEFRDALLIGRSHTAPEKMRQESSAGVHFRELAALTIAAGSLHVCYTTSHPSPAAVWHFLTQHGTFADAIKTMRQTSHTSHGVHQAIAEMSGVLDNIGSGDELGSAWTTTVRPLLLYLDPHVAASTDRSTITLDDLQYGPGPLSLYLLAESSSTLADMYQVYRAILDVTFACLMRHKPQTYTQRLLFVANELPSYGYMPAINKNAAVMRKYGIKGFYIAQDLKQLEDVYGPEPELWSNTECKVFHATGNDRTAKRVTEGYLGKETVEYLVESRQGRRRSVSPHRVGRELLTLVELGQLDPAMLVVHLRGRRPFLMEKVGYDRHFTAA
jgi:type IV secretory pathway TraG/TraD family ATPase VirD4